MPAYQGACHCGAVTFRLVSDIIELTTCDCSLCRQKNALMTKVHERALAVLSGKDLLSVYEWWASTFFTQARRTGSFWREANGPGRARSSHSPVRWHERTNKNAASVSRSGVLDSNIERGEFLVLGRPGSDLLSQGLSHSTIGAEEFNGRVRDGIGLRLFAKTTRPAKDKKTKQAIFVWRLAPLIHAGLGLATLWTLKMRAIKPIERLVPVSCMHCCTSTSGLSTWWSSTVLKGMLVLRWVSRLDAFSGYPVRT